jgi:hypothetical protein
VRGIRLKRGRIIFGSEGRVKHPRCLRGRFSRGAL